MESHTKALPNPGELLKKSFELYKKHYKAFISIGLVSLILYFIQDFFAVKYFPDEAQGVTVPELTGTIAVTFIIITLVTVVVQMLAQIATIKTASDADKGHHILSLLEIYKHSAGLFFPYIFLSILLSLCFMGSAVFFVIPALIIGGYLILSQFFLIIEDKRGLQALSASLYYMKGNWLKVVWRFIVITVGFLIVCGTIFVGIVYLILAIASGSFDVVSVVNKLIVAQEGPLGIVASLVMGFLSYCIYIPITSIYGYLIYKNLKHSKHEPHPETDFKKSRGWLMGLSIFGLILAIILFGLAMLGLGSSISKGMKRGASAGANMNYSQSVFPSEIDSLPSSNASLLEQKVYTNSAFGFSINLPKGWIAEPAATAVEGVMVIPANKEEGKVIQIQSYKTKITSDAMANVIAGAIVADKTDDEEIVYSKVNIGSRLAYRITRTYKADSMLSGSVEYYLITHESGIYAVTIGLSEENENLRPMLIGSVSTFKVLN